MRQWVVTNGKPLDVKPALPKRIKRLFVTVEFWKGNKWASTVGLPISLEAALAILEEGPRVYEKYRLTEVLHAASQVEVQ